ncbi:MAG: hypothetical protein J5994_02675 [Ruminococcus sp.]|nr:hypothetical protein [Ruminococcus sp.]
MSMLGTFADMDQDDKIKALERRLKRLERKQNGGNNMSKMISSLVGYDCTVEIDYDEIKCRILEADEEWIKLLVYGKKGDRTVIHRIENIDSIELD